MKLLLMVTVMMSVYPPTLWNRRCFTCAGSLGRVKPVVTLS